MVTELIMTIEGVFTLLVDEDGKPKLWNGK